MTEKTSPDGHKVEATVPTVPGNSEQAARPATSVTSPTDLARAQLSRPSRSRQQARIDPDKAAMVLVPGGTFWMGISDDEKDRAIEDCKTEFKKMHRPAKVWFCLHSHGIG